MSLSPVRRHQRRTVAIAGMLALAALSLLPAAPARRPRLRAQPPRRPPRLTPRRSTSPRRSTWPTGRPRQSATVVGGRRQVRGARPGRDPAGVLAGRQLPRPADVQRARPQLPGPAVQVTRLDGWLTIRTSGMVLRYELGSGAFSPANTQMRLLGRPPTGTTSVQPAWEWECTFGQVCQSGAAALSGGAALATEPHRVRQPGRLRRQLQRAGADATWQVLGAPAGRPPSPSGTRTTSARSAARRRAR